MVNVSVGHAIGLQNLARPDRSHPITQGIQAGMRINLAKESAKAKADEAAAKRRAQIEEMFNLGGGPSVLPRFQPKIKEATVDFFSEGMNPNADQFSINVKKQQTQQKWKDIEAENKSWTEVMNDNKALVTPEVKKAAMTPGKESDKIVKDFVLQNPRSKLFNIDVESGSVSLNRYENIDPKDEYAKAIGDLIHNNQMTQSKFVKKLDNNTDIYELSASPDQITGIAVTMAHDPQFVENVKVKNSVEFNKKFNEIKKSTPELDDDQADILAVTAIADADLQKLNKTNRFESKHIANTTNNINFIQPPVPGQPKDNSIIITRQVTVTDKNGKGAGESTENFSIPTGQNFGFKAVKVLNPKTTEFIDLSGGKKIDGNSVQEVEVGAAVAVPYATKRLYDSTTNQWIEIGEPIDDKKLKDMEKFGAVQWRAAFPGIVKGKYGDANVLAPADQLRSAVLISQSNKDDLQATNQMISAAEAEANAKNAALPKATKKPEDYTTKPIQKSGRDWTKHQRNK